MSASEFKRELPASTLRQPAYGLSEFIIEVLVVTVRHSGGLKYGTTKRGVSSLPACGVISSPRPAFSARCAESVSLLGLG